jgi:hypothetical protein
MPDIVGAESLGLRIGTKVGRIRSRDGVAALACTSLSLHGY